MAENDAVDSLEKAILKKVYAWLVVGGVAVGGVGGSGILRVNKFTDKDARLLKAEILEHVDNEFLAEEKDCRQFRSVIDKRINVVEWQMELTTKWIEEHRKNVQMFYGHKHRTDDGSVVVKERR